MTERDELTTDYVRDHFVDSMFTSGEASELAYADFADVEEEQARFDAWLESVKAEARRPRVIETADELLALPEGAVVIDNDGDVSQKRGKMWCGHETSGLSSNRLARLAGPFTVLWEGGE